MEDKDDFKVSEIISNKPQPKRSLVTLYPYIGAVSTPINYQRADEQRFIVLSAEYHGDPPPGQPGPTRRAMD